ncbi:MAG: DUF3450 domain-containing protein [Gammaproteobacteria bacterium]|nr:DUF3450 domain-containing protein [Gammaproteobacteria bacterium]
MRTYRVVFGFALLMMLRAADLGAAETAAGGGGPAPGAAVDDVLKTHEAAQQQAARSQSRIDGLDDETLALISAYNSELKRYDNLVTYNTNLRTLVESQQKERARLTSEIDEIEVVRQQLVPLMVEMVETLGRFIDIDQPLLVEERRARLENLQANLTRSDVELAEKFRRVIDAYQIEADYGQTIEAYEGSTTLGGQQLTVDFLRVGRTALYYMTLDRTAGGLWHPERAEWVPLGSAELDGLDLAIRVARKQAPPDLMPLPLWTPDR